MARYCIVRREEGWDWRKGSHDIAMKEEGVGLKEKG